MEIIIKPKKFEGNSQWADKAKGVVLVEKEEDVEPLFKLLLKQDEDWARYKHLIQVAPKEIDSELDIKKMCEYTGKTRIYNPKEVQAKIPFIMYHYIPFCGD